MEKWALITGSAVRLGKAIARKLAAENYNIILHYHSSESELEKLRDFYDSFNIQVRACKADLSREDDQKKLMDFAYKECGQIDLLVNNASIFPEDSIYGFNYSELEANIKINAFAPLQLSRLLAAHTRHKASIINLLDTHIVDFDKSHASYHLSKRMLFDITRILARELAPDIRVNAVAPGLILPPPGKGPDYLEKLHNSNLLQTHGTAEDVANAVFFLAENDFITGQVIYVDGGRHMKGNFYGM